MLTNGSAEAGLGGFTTTGTPTTVAGGVIGSNMFRLQPGDTIAQTYTSDVNIPDYKVAGYYSLDPWPEDVDADIHLRVKTTVGSNTFIDIVPLESKAYRPIAGIVSAAVAPFVNYDSIIDTGAEDFAGIVTIEVKWINPAGSGVTIYLDDLSLMPREVAVGEINIPPGSIGSDELAPDSVGTIHIQDAAVTNAEIGNLAVSTAKIQDAAIDSAKIADLAVLNAKIADLAVTNAKIANATIQGAKIANATITTANIGLAQITTALIGDAQITNAKIDRVSANKLVVVTADIQDAAITGAKILDATITNAEIANATITGAKIANATIGTANIAAAAITTALIANAAVDTAQLKDASITDAKIVNLSAAKINAGTLNTGLVTVQGTGGKLKISGNRLQVFDAQAVPVERVSLGDVNGDGSIYGFLVRGADGTTVIMDQNGVTNAGITDGSITNPKIADGAVDNAAIQDNTITGGKLVTDAITAREIAAATITANEMVVGTITAASGIIANAAITTAKIADLAVTDAKIASLSATKITAGTIDASVVNVTNINAANITTGVLNAARVRLGTTTTYDVGYNPNQAYKTVIDPGFLQDRNFWSASYSGQVVTPSTDGTIINSTESTLGGKLWSITGEEWEYYLNPIPINTLRKYKVTFRVKQTIDPAVAGTSLVYAGVATLDKDFVPLTSGSGTHRFCAARALPITVADGWQEFEGIITGVQDLNVASDHEHFRANTAYVRPVFIVNYQAGTGQVMVDYLKFEDVTDIDDLQTVVADVALRTTEDAIIATVRQSTSYQNDLADKADASDLEDYATHGELDEGVQEAKDYADSAVNGIDFTDFVTQSELTQTSTDLTAAFTQGGGRNYLRNSIGFGGFDFWTGTGLGTTIQTSQSDQVAAIGFGSAFDFLPTGSGARNIDQEIDVITGVTYTLSWWINRRNSGVGTDAGSFRFEFNNGTVLAQKKYINAGTTGFIKDSLTWTATLTGKVKIRCYGWDSAVDVTLTGLMVNTGENAFQWSMHPEEIYNTNIRMDVNGIKVSQVDNGVEVGFTQITPDEFAGYYDTDGNGTPEKIFWLEADETVSKRFRANEEFTLGNIKLINVNGGGKNGWAFVPTVN